MIIYILILLGLVARLIPAFQHSTLGMLFSPILAIALFGGSYLPKKYALVVPALIMLITDYFIGYYNIWLMLSVYGSFTVVALVGRDFKNKKLYNVLFGSIIGALFYYMVTNFAVWYFTDWYPHTSYGLVWCYYMGLPFLKNSLLGTVMYSSILFGAYELSKRTIVWTKRYFLSTQHQ